MNKEQWKVAQELYDLGCAGSLSTQVRNSIIAHGEEIHRWIDGGELECAQGRGIWAPCGNESSVGFAQDMQFRIKPVDPNADSTMPPKWRNMLDVHPNKMELPYAVVCRRGKVWMFSAEPAFDGHSVMWHTNRGECKLVGDQAGGGFSETSLYHIPQDEPAEESVEDDGGWIEWGGGECPFSFDESEQLRLDVCFRRGDGVSDVGAHRVVFSHDGQPGHPPGREAALDIVKYRKGR